MAMISNGACLTRRVMTMTVDDPGGDSDLPFEARAAMISEMNNAADIREEIDDIVGIDDPNWSGNRGQASSFTKRELTLVLLALGGPQ